METIILKEHVPAILVKPKEVNVSVHIPNSATYYGSVLETDRSKELQMDMHHSPYTQEYYYINNTNQPISVKHRDGLSVSVENKYSIEKPSFIIRKILHLKKESFKSAVTALNAIKEINAEDLAITKKTLLEAAQRNMREVSVMIDYAIDLDDIKSNNNAIYHHQTDTIVFIGREDVNHPYSENFIKIKDYGYLYNYGINEEFNLRIRYVNHQPDAGNKYINILGKIISLHPQIDSSTTRVKIKTVSGNGYETIVLKDYVQVYYPSKNIPGNSNGGITIVQLSLEDAKKEFGIYDTYLEAQNYGDISSVRKQQILDKEHEIVLAKAAMQETITANQIEAENRKKLLNAQQHELDLTKLEIEKAKIDLQKDKAEMDVIKAETDRAQLILDERLQQAKNQEIMLDQLGENLKRQREENTAKLKLDQLQWQEHYDRRAQSRKDVSDIIKFVPGLILGVCGIAATYFKMKNSDS